MALQPVRPRRARLAALAAAVVALVLAAAPSASAIQSDGFDGSTLDTATWSFVDPLGDATLTIDGGQARIAVPGGVSHDIWTDGSRAPRLRQAIADGDFEVEAKFDSAVAEQYQMQGIVVEQDADDLLRIELHHDGSATKLFVASFAGGAASVRHYGTVPGGAPAYLRVARVGNDWAVRHSLDGSTWTTATTFTHAMAVAAIGPFAGNSGSIPPPFEAAIDHFREIRPDDAPPVVSGVGSTPGEISATVEWTTDEPATSRVEYGVDTTYADGAVARDDLRTSHSLQLHGLECDRTYHFRVSSADPAGNVSDPGTGSFTTAACDRALTSDEFDGTALDTSVWTAIDPLGDTSLSVGGGEAAIGLPAGTAHDIWAGADDAPRLLQPAPDEDFEVEVKFDSAVGAQYQMQGLVVEQDADDLLRMEVHHDGASTHLFVASLAGGAASVRHDSVVPDGAPVHLRLARAGDEWTLSYSPDGSDWTRAVTFTRALNVTAVGPFAGNSGGSPPATEARIDYFRHIPPDETPPAISGIATEPGPGSTARVTWTTDEPASSEVAFGEGALTDTIAAPGDTRTHSVLLHGLACGFGYQFEVRSTDPSGNSAAAAGGTVQTRACPDLIASDEFDGTALDGDRWALVDPLGDATLAVGGGVAALAVPAGRAHDLWPPVRTAPRLLQAAPDESFEVEAKFDSAVAEQYQMQGIVVEQSHDELLRFETHFEGSQPKLFVAALDGGSASVLHSSVLSAPAPEHMRLTRAGDRWTLAHSADGETWTTATSFDRPLTVRAVGPFVGNAGSPPPAFEGRIEHFREVTDRTPPALSTIAARPRSRSAVVTWTTDEPAGSRVEYRQGDGSWSEVGSAKLATRHHVTIPDLACATAYGYRVRSADALGNESVSAERGLTTAPCTPTGGPDVELWNGDAQTFGAVGIPQTWVNVVGNVSDPDGVASLTASLNGGPPQAVGIGPDGWRLERKGDFNVEIAHAELVPGANSVELRATDGLGNVTARTVALDWRGLGAGAAPAESGPVLVLAAHPDDESLGTAGIIDRARAAGRRVVVAIATNGEGSRADVAGGECNAPGTAEQRAAAYGLRRDGEARAALEVLGASWSPTLAETELVFLGYPGMRLTDVARASEGAPLTDDITGLHRTYAEDFDGDPTTCDGDLRHLLDGGHSQLHGAALAADVDALLDLVGPSDLYTHSGFDGHRDHAELYRQAVAAVRRHDAPVRVHTTLMHPEGDTACMELSAERWPNPALADNDPFARFTPWLDFTAPPAEPCDPASTATDWGPFGAPDELVEVPASMQETVESDNLKWRAISEHETQIDCSNPDRYHVTCGYMRAFVKRHEFFWRYDYLGRRAWPIPYAAEWASDGSVVELAQLLEGEWRHEGGDVRPLATGFDRALLVGDSGWTDYEVTVPFTLHSVDPSKPDAGVGVGLGWQGHTGGATPRVGHPTGGLCLYGRSQPEPSPLRLTIGYSPGPVHDTTVAARQLTLAPGVRHVMRFRQQDVVAGETRYSCKVWRAADPEPAEWTLVADIPHWDGTSQRAGSAVLLAHQVDAAFGSPAVARPGG